MFLLLENPYFHCAVQMSLGRSSQRCEVCHKWLCGYEDGACVKCANIGVCQSCVQTFDANHIHPLTDVEDFKRYRWNGATFDTSVMRTGDRVCLQCGIVTPTTEQRRNYNKYRLVQRAISALLYFTFPCGLLQRSFTGWNRLAQGLLRRSFTAWTQYCWTAQGK